MVPSNDSSGGMVSELASLRWELVSTTTLLIVAATGAVTTRDLPSPELGSSSRPLSPARRATRPALAGTLYPPAIAVGARSTRPVLRIRVLAKAPAARVGR